MVGSLLSCAAGDAPGLVSAISFVLSETAFVRIGHKSWGYSLGCAGISLGDYLLLLSDTTSNNSILNLSMMSLAIAWGIGAIRYPLERFGIIIKPYSESIARICQKIADIIPPTVGSVALILRIPTLYTAAFTGEHFNAVIFVCNIFWGIADVLLGRMQRFVRNIIRTLATAAHVLTRASRT